MHSYGKECLSNALTCNEVSNEQSHTCKQSSKTGTTDK